MGKNHVTAGAAIQTVMEAGLDEVRRLDAIVPNKLRHDPKTLALLERARRVEYRSSRAKSETAESEPAAAAATAAN